jgi:hypothetical protein
MGLTGGVVLLVLGLALVLLVRPRSGGDIRLPWMQAPIAQVLIPTVCLALLTFGVAIIIANL